MFGNVIGKFENNPFLQSIHTLREDKENLIKIIEGNYADEMLPIFKEAFDYFTTSPEDYDGATGDEESGSAKKYDIPSIIHDYLSVLKLDHDFTVMRLSDKLFVAHMKALHFNSLQIKKRQIGLFLISWVRWLRRRFLYLTNKEYRIQICGLDFKKWKERIEFELIALG